MSACAVCSYELADEGVCPRCWCLEGIEASTIEVLPGIALGVDTAGSPRADGYPDLAHVQAEAFKALYADYTWQLIATMQALFASMPAMLATKNVQQLMQLQAAAEDGHHTLLLQLAADAYEARAYALQTSSNVAHARILSTLANSVDDTLLAKIERAAVPELETKQSDWRATRRSKTRTDELSNMRAALAGRAEIFFEASDSEPSNRHALAMEHGELLAQVFYDAASSLPAILADEELALPSKAEVRPKLALAFGACLEARDTPRDDEEYADFATSLVTAGYKVLGMNPGHARGLTSFMEKAANRRAAKSARGRDPRT